MAEGESAPAGAGKIDHVFIVYLENQSFDRVFGSFPGADGDASQKHVTKDWLNGVPFEPTHGTPSWHLRKVWANVFFRGQYFEADRPLWWNWARNFVLADRYRTQEGPSTPNHMALIAATSAGLVNNPWHWKWTTVLQGAPNSKNPPYDVPTLPNLLEEAGISWANYGEGDFDFFTRLQDPNNPGKARNSQDAEAFFEDMAAGKVSQVNWVFPQNPKYQGGLNSLEWTRTVVESIKSVPGLWERSAIFLTWDDWGGYYDHVEPVRGEAPEGFKQGGRVPLLILSPFAKPGHVFHEPAIHASVVRFVERIFGLSPLNDIDAGANDLLGAFDFNQAPLAAPDTSPSLVPVRAAPDVSKTKFAQRAGLRPAPGASRGLI